LAGLDTGRSTRAQAHSTRPAQPFLRRTTRCLQSDMGHPSHPPGIAHPGLADKTGDFRTSDAPPREERQDRWADDRARTVSWMSMNRIDQNQAAAWEADAGPRGTRPTRRSCSKPADLSDGQDPRRGSRPHHDETRNHDGQRDESHSEGPDSRPPVSVVLKLRRLVHARDCSRLRVRHQGHWPPDGPYSGTRVPKHLQHPLRANRRSSSRQAEVHRVWPPPRRWPDRACVRR